MDMTGERRIPAPRQMVWNALNDPEVLRSCIPGCETLVADSPQDMRATAAVRIGPIAARFNGKVQLTDIDEPNGYMINGEGQGGVAGFAKGGARVHLTEEDPTHTVLNYTVQAQVGGKIAQLGARLIEFNGEVNGRDFFRQSDEGVECKDGPQPRPCLPIRPVGGCHSCLSSRSAALGRELVGHDSA